MLLTIAVSVFVCFFFFKQKTAYDRRISDWSSDVCSSDLAPVLFGASRKRMIGALSNEAPVGERLGGSVALAFHAVQMGAQMVRVHDVKETVQAVHLWR